LATTVGFGPRFLHSTGQLHKGDAGRGLFVQITADDRTAVPAALEQLAAGADKEFNEAQVVMAKFYAEHVMPRNHAYGATVRAGSASIMALAAENF
jgi:hypothetical protein